MTAAIISIGDELIYGQTLDTNAHWISQRLDELGISLRCKLTCMDIKEDIMQTLDFASTKAQLIICTGGLGPTNDDLSLSTLVEYLDLELVQNDLVLSHIQKIFERFNRPLLQVNIDQALVPRQGQVLFNELGTAPGVYVEKNKRIYVLLPGVPHEMKYLFDDQLIALLQKSFSIDNKEHIFIETAGIGESFIYDRIKPLLEPYEGDMMLAFLPSLGSVSLRITFHPSKRKKCEKLVAEIEKELGLLVYHIGEKKGLQEKCKDLLIDQKLQLAIAESCTGGAISASLVALPGSSAFMQGSFVSYSNRFKQDILGVDENIIQRFGAVSAECVEAMLESALRLCNSDVALAVSGIAGPDGGSLEKPVGTVYIGVGNGEKNIIKRFNFIGRRAQVIDRTIVHSLNQLRRLITGQFS